MNRIVSPLLACAIASQLAFALPACQSGGGPVVGSETHFLSICSNGDSCGEGLHCVCGACTISCSDDDECESGARCEATSTRPLSQSCAEKEVEATCEIECSRDDDCESLGGSHTCERGLCRKPAEACSDTAYASDDFVLLGDNFLANSGQVTVELEGLLRSRGVLSDEDRLRDYSSSVVSPFGGTQDLFSQYELARAEGAGRIAILDAGGPDALLDCDVDAADLCPNLENGRAGTERLLTTLAQDGFEHVVLFFYPRPDDAALADKFNLLEGEMKNVCAMSAVACHFLSLAPLFEQERDTWLTGMGLFPSEEGAVVTAGAVFNILQQTCVVR